MNKSALIPILPSDDWAAILIQGNELRGRMFSRIKNHPGMAGRTNGGFLCIGDDAGQPLLFAQLGVAPENRLGQYSRNALTKVQGPGYAQTTLSRQLRNPNHERWNGGVNLSVMTGSLIQRIIGFSGWDEDADEAFSLQLGIEAYQLPRASALSVMQAFSNPYLEPLRDLF